MRVWDGLTKPGPPPEQTQCAKAGGETSVLASFIEAGCLLLPQKRTLTGLADDMRRKPYVERTATLRKLLRGDRGIQYVEQAEEHGERLFAAVCKPGLRGIVSKTIRCALSIGVVRSLNQGQKSKGTARSSRTEVLAELRHRPNGYSVKWRFLMSFKSVFFGLAVLLSASSVSMAQSMPNYGPNPPPNTDSFGQVPSGAKPPGVSRYGHRAYAYVPNQHRRHYRYWHHRHWY